jgi:hypothetical protein
MEWLEGELSLNPYRQHSFWLILELFIMIVYRPILLHQSIYKSDIYLFIAKALQKEKKGYEIFKERRSYLYF